MGGIGVALGASGCDPLGNVSWGALGNCKVLEDIPLACSIQKSPYSVSSLPDDCGRWTWRKAVKAQHIFTWLFVRVIFELRMTGERDICATSSETCRYRRPVTDIRWPTSVNKVWRARHIRKYHSLKLVSSSDCYSWREMSTSSREGQTGAPGDADRLQNTLRWILDQKPSVLSSVSSYTADMWVGSTHRLSAETIQIHFRCFRGTYHCEAWTYSRKFWIFLNGSPNLKSLMPMVHSQVTSN